MRMSTKTYLFLIMMTSTTNTFLCQRLAAEESVEYVAEHLLEVPMDTRALAYPVMPSNIHRSESRLQLGYGSVGASKLNNEFQMLAFHFYSPINEHWGVLAGGFYDSFKFSGKKGKAVGEVLVVSAPQIPDKFDITINDVSGGGKYAGTSLAVTYHPGGSWRWQLGYAYADMDIKKFKTDFDTTSLIENFSGSFDYAGQYHINTIFYGVEMTPRKLSKNVNFSPHLIVARNSPRVGFKGRVIGPNFDISGNTETNGRGTHIPDNYMGVGINVEHIPSGFRIDLGATLYTFSLEPAAHKGIRTPLFLTCSLPIF